MFLLRIIPTFSSKWDFRVHTSWGIHYAAHATVFMCQPFQTILFTRHFYKIESDNRLSKNKNNHTNKNYIHQHKKGQQTFQKYLHLPSPPHHSQLKKRTGVHKSVYPDWLKQTPLRAASFIATYLTNHGWPAPLPSTGCKYGASSSNTILEIGSFLCQSLDSPQRMCGEIPNLKLCSEGG